MKALVDALIIIGIVVALLGLIAKVSGILLVAPVITSPANHIILATFFLVLALIIDFKTK